MDTVNTDSYDDLLPSSISSDPQVISFGNVMDERAQILLPLMDQIRVFCNLENQPEEILDLVAFQWSVLFYSSTFIIQDQATRIAAKLNLLKNNFFYYGRLGTPDTLQQIISTVYPNASVLEWFQYGGTAHHYRILLDKVITDQPTLNALNLVNQTVKRASSWFEGFFVKTQSPPVPLLITPAIYVQIWQKSPLAK